MKKSLFVTLLIAMGSIFANAQLYMGGGLGIGLEVNDNASEINVNLSPEIGYSISNRWDVGGEINLGVGYKKTEAGIIETEIVKTNWKLAPYARYAIVKWNKFSVLLKGSLVFSNTISSTQTNNYDPTLSSTTAFGLEVLPLLTYNLSEKFLMYTELNFLGLSFQTSEGSTKFNLGVNSNNLLNTSSMKIGFFYKF